jgi:putative transposase
MNNLSGRNKRKIKLLCSVAALSTQGYYQTSKRTIKAKFCTELIIEHVYELRKIRKEIGVRSMLPDIQKFALNHGFKIGRDSLFSLLEENNLLIRKRRKNAPVTTQSKHRFKKYPNIIKDIVPLRPNQIWVSDITYVETGKKGFSYLSLITDMYSRKVIGYSLSKNLSAEGPLKALEMAIKSASEAELKSVIHHSDRGVQYCCNEYIRMLTENGIRVSMTNNGDPLENPIAERVNGIIKNEYHLTIGYCFNILGNKLTESIFHYNNYRKHKSIEDLTPSVAHQTSGHLARMWKTYKKNNELASGT